MSYKDPRVCGPVAFVPGRVPRHPEAGFTLISVLIATFVLGTIITGIFGLFLLSLRLAHEGERRVVAIALANERMEMVRNLPYVDVGTQGGVPPGDIPQQEDVTRNGLMYSVRTDIRYVDDEYDGTVGGIEQEDDKVTICHKPGTANEKTLEVSAAALDAHLAHGDSTGACGSGGEGSNPGDEFNADYKQARVEVSWSSPTSARPVLLITHISPQGIEGGELGGTLDFQALNAAGEAVAGATVHLENDTVSPSVDVTTQTNAEGRVVLPGLPESLNSYQLTVTKAGHTAEQTYTATSTFIPDPDHSHFSMLIREVTNKTFFIDLTSSLSIVTQDEASELLPNIAYRLRGTKTIGVDDDGDPVYTVDVSGGTDATSAAVHPTLAWDAYSFSIDGPVTGYDIKETSLLLPLALAPAQDAELTVTLVEHTPVSLHITVADANGAAVDNATVRLTGHGLDQSPVTGAVGQVFFADLPVNGDYALEISAPNFEPVTQAVEVTDTMRLTVQLTAIEG